MSLYLAVNKNGEFRIFNSWQEPKRYKKDILVQSDTEFEEDYYGHVFHAWIPSGEQEEIWICDKRDCMDRLDTDEGEIIDKSFLSQEFQSMTYEDKPVKLSKF